MRESGDHHEQYVAGFRRTLKMKIQDLGKKLGHIKPEDIFFFMKEEVNRQS